ncbi:MAG TPA: hypothetical protein VHO50_07680 [Bacteroidales bacterium]|nr:hypothetical protein [Bacteroidales bacterium]
MSLFIAACSEEPDFNKSCINFEICFRRESGWTGLKYEANFFSPDSLVVFESEYLTVVKNRLSRYSVSPMEMDSLLADLSRIKRMDLSDNYGFGSNKPTDLPVRFIRYRYCNNEDSTFLYFPEENELPVDLENLLGKLNRIIMEHDTLIGNFKKR